MSTPDPHDERPAFLPPPQPRQPADRPRPRRLRRAADRAWGSGRSRGLTGAAVAALIMIVVVFGAGALVRLNPQPDPRPTAPAPRWPPPPGTSSPTPWSPEPLPSVTPLAPRWQAVPYARGPAAYDVPVEDWTARPTVMVGYETREGPTIGMGGVAMYRVGGCTEGDGRQGRLATVGMMRPGPGLVPEQSAAAEGRRWALAALTDDEDVEHPLEAVERTRSVESVAFPGTSLAVSSYTFDRPFMSRYACDSPAMRVSVAALRAPDGGAAILVVLSHQRVPGALTLAEEDAIIATVRPL